MYTPSLTFLSLLVLGASWTQQVESINDEAFHGNSNPLRDSSAQINETLISEFAATPWWYERIAHQGISAFGPAGYQVYRNVKDYGAKGSSSMPMFTILKPIQILIPK